MAAMHFRDLVILCCYLVIFVALGIVIRWEYFTPCDSDPTGEKSKRTRLRAYITMAIAWAVMAIAQWWKIAGW
jgi:hypothetical protein